MREEGKDVFTCESFRAFSYFDIVCQDGGASEDGLVHVEFGTVCAAFGTELDDEDGCCEIARVWRGFC